jgi:uncharacterized protein YprB with RNaseH-like and TPR domain
VPESEHGGERRCNSHESAARSVGAYQGEVERIRRKIRAMRRETFNFDRAGVNRRPFLPSHLPPNTPTRMAASLMGAPVSLADATGGVEVRSNEGFTAHLIESRPCHLGAARSCLDSELRDALVQPDSALRRRLADLCGSQALALDDIVWLDLETTGLNTTPLFLVGLMTCDGKGLLVRQYFARDYSEEAGVIWFLTRNMADKKLLVSFNGKAFDVPYIRMRAAANGIPLLVNLPHLDLLHECRRVWGNALPDCKLQTLENFICGRVRECDIAGSEIPDAYHEYVRTGDARRIVEIIRRNLLDLVTMAELLLRLPTPE